MGFIIEFTEFNGSMLETPIEWRISEINPRIRPTNSSQDTRIGWSQAINNGLFIPWTPAWSRDVQPFQSGRYTMSNGNYFEVERSSPTEFYAHFNWGYDFENVEMNDQFLLLFNIEPQSNFDDRNAVYFATDGISYIRPNILKMTTSNKIDDISGYDLYISSSGSTIDPKYIREFFNGMPQWEEDTTIVQGGMGDTNNDTEDITLPNLPTLEPLDCGMFTMYAPTPEQMKQFSSYLWSSSLIDTIPKLFQDPMEALIGLSIIPVNFPLGSQKEIKVGNIGTNVSSLTVSKQFYELDCGKIKISEYWGNALDYNNTKIELYLPFISTITLDTELCMNSTISVKYRIDLFTGTCMAFVTVEKPPLKASIFSFVGNCAVNIPLSARNFSQTISTLAGLGITAFTGAISGGALTPSLLATTGLGALGSAVSGGMKTHVQKMNSVQMQAGYFGVWKPYVVITRPVQALPNEFDTLKGYTSLITAQIGSTSGYCEIEYIHLENISATADELTEIEELLKSGVII